jgi:serine/threonine-protein kinase
MGSQRVQDEQHSPSSRRRDFHIRRVLLTLAFISLAAACGLFEAEEPAVPLPAAEAGAPHLVVMPFANLGNSDDDYFPAALTDETTDRLTAVSGLVVISRSSAKALAADESPIATVAEELGADHVLSANVRLDRQTDVGPRLQLDARLLRVADESVVWRASYDRAFSEVFDVLSDLALEVVETLDVPLAEPERRLIESRPTADMAAYEAYLRGLPYRWSFELGELESAGANFGRAVELDPGFALAYVALSEYHSQMFHFRYDRSPQRLASAYAAAHRALEIEPGLSEGHRALGYYYYWGQRNFAQALAEFSAAAAGRPSDPLIVASIGIVLRRQGRWEEALEALRQTAVMDPKSDVNAIDLASTCARIRRYDEAADHCRRAIEIAPDDIFPYVFYARVLRARDGTADAAGKVLEAMPDKDPAQQSFYRFEQALFERDYNAALLWLQNADELISDPINEEVFPRSLCECEARVRGGATGSTLEVCQQARAALERARELSPADPALHSALGWSCALLGQRELAIEAGQRAVELLPVSADAMAGHSYLVRLAKIYAWTDEPYKAVKTIQKALSLPGWLSVRTLQHDPVWDPIRSDPRFKELLKIHGAEE